MVSNKKYTIWLIFIRRIYWKYLFFYTICLFCDLFTKTILFTDNSIAKHHIVPPKEESHNSLHCYIVIFRLPILLFYVTLSMSMPVISDYNTSEISHSIKTHDSYNSITSKVNNVPEIQNLSRNTLEKIPNDTCSSFYERIISHLESEIQFLRKQLSDRDSFRQKEIKFLQNQFGNGETLKKVNVNQSFNNEDSTMNLEEYNKDIVTPNDSSSDIDYKNNANENDIVLDKRHITTRNNKKKPRKISQLLKQKVKRYL